MGTTSETKVTDHGGTTIPAEIRESLDIDPGDKIRWTITDEGELTVEVVKQETGVFDDFEPVSLGGDGAEAHDTAGAER
jgi:AbrB family looped-hinge helix DNA binding protein